MEKLGTVVLENSIMQKGQAVTAGSKMLESFVSPIDATVVERLESAGVCIIGSAEMDEFGACGLFASDGGCSAVDSVADGVADFAFCNDYTGAISQVAAMRGVCYIHPTYGTVSRYGLIPCVPSMDQIGVVCRDPEDGFRALSMIVGYDARDGVMAADAERQINGKWKIENGKLRWLRMGVPRGIASKIPDLSDIEEHAKNFEIVEFELKYSDIYTQVMRILCCAELSNNISRYDGIKFGYRAKEYDSLRELYTKSRTEAFGADVKLAAMLGAMVLSQENYTRYYDKAMRLRRLIRDSLDFNTYDAVVLPHCLTALSRLCGLPSVTISGCTYIANAGREDVLMAVCKGIRGGAL